MEFTRLKDWNVFGLEEKHSSGWSWMVATQVTDAPLGLAF